MYRHKRWCWSLWSIICLQHDICSLCLLSDCFGLIRSHFVQPLVVKVKMWHVEKTCQTKKHPHQALRGPIALPYPGQIWYGPIVGCIEFASPIRARSKKCSKNECSTCAKPRCVFCSPSWVNFKISPFALSSSSPPVDSHIFPGKRMKNLRINLPGPIRPYNLFLGGFFLKSDPKKTRIVGDLHLKVIKLGHGWKKLVYQMLIKIWGMLLGMEFFWWKKRRWCPSRLLVSSQFQGFCQALFVGCIQKNKWHRILGGALDILSHLTSWGFDVWTPQNLPIKHHQTSCSDVFKDVYSPVNKHSNGKSPSWIGKTSSNGGFSIAMLDYRSVPGDSSRDLFGDGEFTWPFLGVVGDLQRSRIKGHRLNHLVGIDWNPVPRLDGFFPPGNLSPHLLIFTDPLTKNNPSIHWTYIHRYPIFLDPFFAWWENVTCIVLFASFFEGSLHFLRVFRDDGELASTPRITVNFQSQETEGWRSHHSFQRYPATWAPDPVINGS